MPVTITRETSWFEAAVARNAFSVWFQPVIDTTTRRIVGHECLIRLTTGYRREGAEIMAAASARRDIQAFDSYTRRLAMRAVSSQSDSGAACFLNFIPSAIGEPSELLKDTAPRPANIVMEAHRLRTAIADIVHLRRIGDYLHKQGLRLLAR